MARTMFWAVGVVVAIAGYSSLAGGRLARSLPSPASQSATVGDPKAGTGASAQSAGPRILVLNADLRGHYAVHGQIDGLRVKMLVDTGATYVALSYDDALKAGIRVEPRDFKLRMSTANGVASAAPVKIAELKVGDILVRNVDAVVCSPGALGTSLLGMSFLRKLGSFEMSQGRLTLRG